MIIKIIIMIIKQKQINRKVLPNCARKKISLNCKRSNLNRCSNYTELACFQVHCFSKKNSSPKGNFIVPVQRLFCWHDYKNPCILTKEEKKNQTNQPLLLTSLQWLKKQQCLTACNYSTSYKQTTNILRGIDSRNWSALSTNKMTYHLTFVTGGWNMAS